MSMYPLIEAEKEEHAVATSCRLLEVSRAAYYEWSCHLHSARQVADEEQTRGPKVGRGRDDNPRVARSASMSVGPVNARAAG